MKRIVHPSSEELAGLVENEIKSTSGTKPEPDTSWRWMVVIAVVIGLFAWFTR